MKAVQASGLAVLIVRILVLNHRSTPSSRLKIIERYLEEILRAERLSVSGNKPAQHGATHPRIGDGAIVVCSPRNADGKRSECIYNVWIVLFLFHIGKR